MGYNYGYEPPTIRGVILQVLMNHWCAKTHDPGRPEENDLQIIWPFNIYGSWRLTTKVINPTYDLCSAPSIVLTCTTWSVQVQSEIQQKF